MLYLSEVIKEVNDQFHSLATLPPEKAAQGPTYPTRSVGVLVDPTGCLDT